MELTFVKRLAPKASTQLTPVEQRQLKEAIERWNGEVHEDLDAFLSGDEGYVELYEVLSGGKRVYDAWVFPTDDASFYVAGTDEALTLHVVQGGVDSLVDEVDEPLRSALQDGYNRIFG
jgi:hypothetical protein